MKWEVIFPADAHRVVKSEFVEADTCFVNPGNGLIFSRKVVAPAPPEPPPPPKPNARKRAWKPKPLMVTSRGFNAGSWADFREVVE